MDLEIAFDCGHRAALGAAEGTGVGGGLGPGLCAGEGVWTVGNLDQRSKPYRSACEKVGGFGNRKPH